MDQDDIFRLLLTVLLLANRQLADETETDNAADDFSYTTINDLLIIVMATQLFSSPENGEKDTTF